MDFVFFHQMHQCLKSDLHVFSSGQGCSYNGRLPWAVDLRSQALSKNVSVGGAWYSESKATQLSKMLYEIVKIKQICLQIPPDTENICWLQTWFWPKNKSTFENLGQL